MHVLLRRLVVRHCTQVCAIGYASDYPPADLPGMLAFLDSLGDSEVSQAGFQTCLPPGS